MPGLIHGTPYSTPKPARSDCKHVQVWPPHKKEEGSRHDLRLAIDTPPYLGPGHHDWQNGRSSGRKKKKLKGKTIVKKYLSQLYPRTARDPETGFFSHFPPFMDGTWGSQCKQGPSILQGFSEPHIAEKAYWCLC